MAGEFLTWLSVPAGRRWLDVACGTGALSQAILQICHPAQVCGLDFSMPFASFAKATVGSDRAAFFVGDAQALPVESGAYDVVVSGLALNFFPLTLHAVADMVRAARPGGQAAAYVWDYEGKMEMLRHFWDAAAALNPAAYELDEGRRFPLCQPGPLEALFREAGLKKVDLRPIEIATRFQDFDDFWLAIPGRAGPSARLRPIPG